MNLVETEYAFAATAKEKGIRDSFLEFIDDEGIVFNPHPVKGKDYYSNAEKRPGFLFWYPSYSVISSAGDLGVNTGPWEYKRTSKDESIAFGQFVSVWKKQKSGEYKFVIDFGNSHSKPETEIPAISSDETRVILSGLSETISYMEAKNNIIRLEQRLSEESAKHGVVNVYRNIITSNTRYLSDGTFPVLGNEILDTLNLRSPHITWEPIDGMGTTSNDFGYTYGKAVVWANETMDDKKQSLYYMHIWEKVDCKWKLLIEVNSIIQEEANE